MMGRHLSTAIATIVLITAPLGAILLAGHPVPSKYPVAWELKFNHKAPQRIVVVLPDRPPTAYWYLPYTVTNNTGQEQTFLPFVELVTSSGAVVRSDAGIPRRVFDAIKARERNDLMESPEAVGGIVRLGPEQARDSVAIWEEPASEMGAFSIYVGGLSGEKTMVDVGGQETVLRKTLELNYSIRGDEVQPGNDLVTTGDTRWVMR